MGQCGRFALNFQHNPQPVPTVVHADELVVGVGPLGVGVGFAGHAVSGPPGVRDADVVVQGLLHVQLQGVWRTGAESQPLPQRTRPGADAFSFVLR